jgi:hypothetical protein
MLPGKQVWRAPTDRTYPKASWSIFAVPKIKTHDFYIFIEKKLLYNKNSSAYLAKISTY